jgi:pimeloyl-ACP methyl ester carboxylesterase
MADYVDLGGVRTWYEEQGSGEPVVLLHPGMVDSRAYGPNIDALAAGFRVFTPERRGHGHTPDVAGPITFDDFADDTIAFLEKVVGGPAHLVGCSDGATVALLAALKRPDLVRRLVFIASVFHRDGWLPGVLDTDDEVPEFFVDGYAEVSPDGRSHFPVIAAKMAQMHVDGPTLSADDLRGISSRTLVMAGDDDEVALEHLIAAYRAIPDAELAVVPGTSHGLMVEKPDLVNRIVVDFLRLEPVPTFAPIRRAG